MSPEELKKLKKREKEREKELYSKECVAQSINFVVSEASDEVTDLNVLDRFSCYLATILARDKEVVAVWLKIVQGRCEIYLSKNFDWLDKDVEYIDNITKYLKNISKNAPEISEDTESDFFGDVVSYCSTKLKSRLDKLKNDIEICAGNKYVKSFRDFFSAKVGDTNNTSLILISLVCNKYYKQVEDESEDESDFPPKFLGHIKKVGSYIESIKGIIVCARKKQYKSLFSNIKVFKGRPVIINDQPIYSWKNIIKRFIDEDKYKRLMDKCSKKPEVIERINKVYTDNATQQQPLDDDDVKQCIYLHAEMNILAPLIIDSKIKSRVFIAVSKRCCYLCELYIDFAIKQGYNIVVSGKHGKIYSKWILPHVKDNNFKARSLTYILENLDRIIEKKLENSVNCDSPDPFDDSDSDIDDGDDEFMGEYTQYHIEKYALL
ncbi:hypothetical protein RhiirA5_472470 [Rhizophagus irregularis]|uniref:Uncharacterized protein n=1 Tax=Rhizophagus irregularis TaxID=588596 RepID=A0A2N0NNC7_9GLOM|nr:hypothetical protein RhiirA5_472470 [Rhizophagus irregularis]